MLLVVMLLQSVQRGVIGSPSQVPKRVARVRIAKLTHDFIYISRRYSFGETSLPRQAHQSSFSATRSHTRRLGDVDQCLVFAWVDVGYIIVCFHTTPPRSDKQKLIFVCHSLVGLSKILLALPLSWIQGHFWIEILVRDFYPADVLLNDCSANHG
jgi:hypothetical protein